MHFDLTDLRLFLAICREGSITAGAARVNLALASASARIAGLEAEAGTRLLVRGRAGAHPTPAGEALVHHARRLLAQAEQMQGELARYGTGLKGHLRLFSNTAALSGRLGRDLATFLAAHPDVDADLEEQPSAAIAVALRDGRAHLGVLSGAVGLEGLDHRFYAEDRLMALLPRTHPFAAAPDVLFAGLAQEPFVGLGPAVAIQAMISAEAARLGLALKMRVRATSFPVLVDCVAAGVGVAVLPQGEAERLSARTDLCVRPLADAWARRPLVIATKAESGLPDFARRAFEALSPPVTQSPPADRRSGSTPAATRR